MIRTSVVSKFLKAKPDNKGKRLVKWEKYSVLTPTQGKCLQRKKRKGKRPLA